MAKRIGAIDQSSQGELIIECLKGLDPQEQVQKVADSFAKVSQEYGPVNIDELPAFLPAEKAPQVEVYQVYKRIQSQKKTRSTLDMDIPHSLRKAGAEFLAEPLTDIFNSSLKQGKYPRPWKQEMVTPVPKKKKTLKQLNDVRKIASTSDYSKIFEHILLELIFNDISGKIDSRQYGGRKGVGTEHLLITLIDRVKKALDDPESLTVILSSYDWKGAFDRVDPTNVIRKLILLGVRSSLVNVLIDFLNERKMQVKMNGKTSSNLDLIGGGPQGSIIGQLLYIIASNDVVQDIPNDDKFKYIDDLSIVEEVRHKPNLMEYDVLQHVPSDVATGQRFLPHSTFKTQDINNQITQWTEQNKMKLNSEKSNYMVVSSSKENFATRLTLDNAKIDRVKEICHLGVWITEDMTWNKHVSQICKGCYPRVKMLSKLKYVGVEVEELINIYTLFIRSKTEYCSTVFHSSLSERLSDKIEAIQKTCLRVILGEMYISYEAALEMSGLESLHMRRTNRSLKFALKCASHPTASTMFPPNPTLDTHDVRYRERFEVNKSRTETYKKSAIPYLQRRLNEHQLEMERARREGGPGGGAEEI
jgi:hypothetical protein